jgi:lysophospholipase L1-like esterase
MESEPPSTLLAGARRAAARAIGPRALAAAIALAAVEVGLSLATSYGERQIVVQDARLGWRMLPNQERRSLDLGTAVSINSFGFRDRQWDAPPAPDEDLCIAVLGNSLTFGTGVAAEHTWPEVLERGLASAGALGGAARRVEVMNFAVEGYVLEQEARVAEDCALDWRPDVVLFALIVPDVAPMPAPEGMPALALPAWLVKSATFAWLSEAVMQRWLAPPLAFDELASEALATAPSLLNQPFLPENRPLWEAAGARLEGLRARVESQGGRLAIVTLPIFRKRVFPARLPSPATYWEPWCRERGVQHVDCYDLFRRPMFDFEQALAEHGFVDRAGSRVVDPAMPHAGEALVLLGDPEHYNERGHALVADAVQRALEL